MSDTPVLHRQLDRCDVCGVKTHRHKLVRTQVRWLQPQSENQFLYSSYNSAFWTADDASSGNTSIGTKGDLARTTVSAASVVSLLNGTATWDTSTTLTSAAVDVSSMTNLCMSFHVGPQQDSTTPELTVSSGYFAQTKVTKTGKSGDKIWWTVPVADLIGSAAAVTFFVTITATGNYWLDDFQLEDATSPGEFIATTGAASSYSVDTALMSVRKVCPNCRERLLNTTGVYRPYGSSIEDPIPMDQQEM